MTTAVILDGDFLQYIAEISLASKDPDTGVMDKNLDALYAKGAQIVLTSTVINEQTFGATDKQPPGKLGYPKDDLIEAWINDGISSGRIIREDTSKDFPPARDAGEKSIDSIITKISNDYSDVIVSSNDKKLRGAFQNNASIADGKPYPPNTTFQEPIDYLATSMLSGSITYAEYYVNAINISGKAKGTVIEPGLDYTFVSGSVVSGKAPSSVGANTAGLTGFATGITLSTNGAVVTIRDRNGIDHEFTAYEKFSIDGSGNIHAASLPITFATLDAADHRVQSAMSNLNIPAQVASTAATAQQALQRVTATDHQAITAGTSDFATRIGAAVAAAQAAANNRSAAAGGGTAGPLYGQSVGQAVSQTGAALIKAMGVSASGGTGGSSGAKTGDGSPAYLDIPGPGNRYTATVETTSGETRTIALGSAETATNLDPSVAAALGIAKVKAVCAFAAGTNTMTSQTTYNPDGSPLVTKYDALTGKAVGHDTRSGTLIRRERIPVAPRWV